ncbi:MAG: glucose-6-phosphate dehydrogenase [Actinomycetota bacterium]
MNENASLIPENHVIVVFGANGDLSRRKLLPALVHLDAEGLMPKDYRIIASARSEMTDEEFRGFALAATREFSRHSPGDDEWEGFARRLSYVSSDFGPDNTEATVQAVRRAEAEIGGEPRRLFYLAVPPTAFEPITAGLHAGGLRERARVIFEKPFGSDIDSYRRLNETVTACLDESQVYRIDHYLGKETVQNIFAFRFANGMFEPVWNRSHIDHVQIDVPEDLDVANRSAFYEQTGAFRDMVVSHLFQVLAVVAMDPPAAFTAGALLDEKVKVFEAMVPMSTEDVVRGQYDGYRDIEGVDPHSETETFVAARVLIDNWRWTGIPFYLRTGKRMAESRSSITLGFRDPPRRMFRNVATRGFGSDHLTIELGPHEGISITFLAKIPGPSIELGPANMNFHYEGSFGSELIEAYERLLHDALLGDRTLFTRADGIERTWEVVTEVLERPPPLHSYPQGSWGPEAAVELIAPRRWHFPADLDH